MKTLLTSLAVVVLAAMPLTASAAVLASGQQYSMPASQAVAGNMYVAAGTATFGGDVTGDVAAVAGTLSTVGAISGDVLAIGGTVQLLGPVGGDIRVAGGTVSINDRVGGEVLAAGGTVHLLPKAVVQGDLIVAAGQVVIDGTVQGSVRMLGGQLTVNGTVLGNVNVRANKQIILGPDAHIGGTVTYTASGKAPAPHMQFPASVMWAIIGVLTGMKLLAMLGLGALILWVWRKRALEMLAQAQHAFWPSLGRGFVYVILVPIAAILLLVSLVGSLAGLILVLVYLIALLLASVLAGMFLGSWLVKIWKKQSTLRLSWWSGLVGIILMSVLSLVPIVGWILAALLDMVMFGVVAHAIQRRISER